MKNALLAEIHNQAWAIEPSALGRLIAQIEAGHYEIDAQTRPQTRQQGSVAVLPVSGPIMSRDSLIARMFGLATSEGITRQVSALAQDPSIGAIVLDMDTPGGSVGGVKEAAAVISSLRGETKIVAVSNHLMASAGFFIASGADEIVASPSSLTGSIGVISVHLEVAKALEEAGIGVNVMSAGKFKAEGNQFEPLSEEGREAMQDLLDQFFDQFVTTVAENRDAKPSEVRNGFGQGRVLSAKDALAEGLVDRIESFDSVLNRLSASKRAQVPRRKMAADLALLDATKGVMQ